MPPRTKAPAGFASLIESDSEPDFDRSDAVGSQASLHETQTMPPPKRRGRPPANANRVTKPAQRAGRRNSGGASRQALREKSNNASRDAEKGVNSETEPEDANSVEKESLAPTQSKRGRPKASASSRDASAPKPGRGRPPKARPAPAEEILETQPTAPMDVDEVEVEDEQRTQTEDEKEPSVAPGLAEEDIMIDVDGDDVSVRRRLGELSKRYENLEARHKDLREVGVKEAERNYERLKKQSEANSAAANKLITELKAELAAKKSVSQRLDTSEAKSDSLQTKVAELTNSLSTARNEIKTLSNKLAAARNAEANIKVPGSALKTGGSRGGPSVEVVQTAQAKEDLYGDLTGLIIRGMKHEDSEDVFDCIQTGRNGTLHFKLGLDAGSGDNYEDVQYTYRPQLDEGRDGELMDMLPDFLVEEITFARPHASKFYTRIIKSLTERLEE